MNEFEAPIEKSEPVKPARGCFFYGCITAICLSVVCCLMLGLAAYSGYRYYSKMVQQYTSTSPVKLPPVTLSPEDTESLQKRIDAFKKSLDTGEDVQPLVLTADEVNAQIAQQPDFKDRVHVEIPGDTIEGQVSLPLDKVGLPGLSGRYLNGKATFGIVLTGGQLFVTLKALEVNGKPMPEESLRGFRNQNLAAGFADNPENAAAIRKLESIEVKDGKLIITPRKKSENAEDKDEKTEATKTPGKSDETEDTSKEYPRASSKD